MHDIVLPAKIWEMKDGLLVKVKIDNDIFALLHEKKPIVENIIKRTRKPRKKRFHSYSHVSIRNDILKEVEEVLSKDKTADISDILQKHFPDVSTKTIKSYRFAYRKELQRLHPRKFGNLVKTYNRTKRTKRSKPLGAVAYNKTYNTYVKQDHINKVLRAINIVELNYKPTAKEIQKRTGLSKTRMYITLRHLLDKKVISYRLENRKLIYVPISNETYKQPPVTPTSVLKELSEGPFTVVELAKRLECSKDEIKDCLKPLLNSDKVIPISTNEGFISYKKV